MTILGFLTPAVLDRLYKPTGQANGLPRETYTSPEFLSYEQERVFARNWVFVCAVDELAEPGTAIPFTVAGCPIVTVSDKKGEIRAFHNVCSHRGTVLVTEPCRHLGVIKCPYHSWAYALDGTLRTAPHVGGHGVHEHPDFDKGKLGLRPVRCKTWQRLVFVNLSSNGPSLAEFVAPLARRWPIDYSVLRLGGIMSFELKANWKLALENFLESYHLSSIHPGLNSYSRMEDHYNFFLESCCAGQGSMRYDPPVIDGIRLPLFPDLPPHLVGRGEYPVLFPNLMIGTQDDHFFLITSEPVTPDLTRERLYIFFVGDEAMGDKFAEARRQTLERWRQVNLEDMDVIERMQRGRYSPAMVGGRFAPELDACVHDFQKHVVAKLLEGERTKRFELGRAVPVAVE